MFEDNSSKPIRILHVIGIMNRGGAEMMIMNLYRHIDRSRIQFDFVEHTESKAVFDDEIRKLGGEIYHCPRFTGMNCGVYRRWWRSFFRRNRSVFSAVHGHIGSTAAIYLSEAKRAGIFAIAHSHNTYGQKSIRSFLYQALAYRTRYIADYFFGCSKAAGVDRYGSKIVSGDRFSLLYNAIDVDEYRFNEAVRSEVRGDLGIKRRDLVIGHVGRFAQQKNHRFLIRCFGELSREREDVRLLLIGGGELDTEIEAQIDSEGLWERVTMTGVRSDVYRLLQAMDVFVFPSLYEGLPVTMVEAQTTGLPCVISDTITDQVVLIEDLVKKESLRSKPEIWCRDILEMAGKERYDRSAEVMDKGYDIHTTARWLEEFYLDKAGQ